MAHPASRTLPLALLAIAAAGCHETDAAVELNAKGSATLSVGVKFGKPFLNAATALAKAVPDAPSILKEADPLFLANPEPDLRKELEEKGLKILLLESKRSDAEMSSNFKVELQRLSALEQLARILGGVPTTGEVPAESGFHLPVDALRLSRDKEGIYSLEAAFPIRVGARVSYPPDAGGGAGSPKVLAAQILGTILDGRSKVTMTVPSEVIDFSPVALGHSVAPKGSPKAPHRTVVFQINKNTIPQSGLSLTDKKGDFLPVTLKVRFKMTGRAFPADALWDGKPAAGVGTPASGPGDSPK